MTTFTGTNTGAVVAMLDNSDGTNKYYAVARLADNRCWMISNYARVYGTYVNNIAGGVWNGGVSGSGTTTSYYLNPSDTTHTLMSSNIRACTGVGYATTAQQAIDYLADSGNTTANSIRNCGYLYNWLSATAGTGTTSVNQTYADSSICPSGWHLATITSSITTITVPASWGSDPREYYTLVQKLGTSSAAYIGSSSQFRAVYSGWATAGSYLRNQGTGTFFFSSIANTTRYAYNIILNTNAPNYSGTYNKYDGEAIRCVLNV
jgi:uncharacterized protein (TIGR02145 family)